MLFSAFHVISYMMIQTDEYTCWFEGVRASSKVALVLKKCG